MSQVKVFRGYCDGFEFMTADIGAMQAWINARKADSKGKVLKLHQGVGTVRSCGAITATFDGNCPSRQAVL